MWGWLRYFLPKTASLMDEFQQEKKDREERLYNWPGNQVSLNETDKNRIDNEIQRELEKGRL